MNEEKQKGLQDLAQSKHGLYTIAGLVVAVIIGLILRNDAIFGLVMGTVYISGLRAGRTVITQIELNAPEEGMQPAKLVGPVVAAVIAGIIAMVIISVIRGAVGEESFAIIPEDNIIVQIVKHFFDHGAAFAVAIGLVVGAWGLGKEEE